MERWLKKASPERFVAGLERELAIDITELLPKISARTLILHRRGVTLVPVSAVKPVAAGIRGSTYSFSRATLLFRGLMHANF
jgi:hypothetical protein